MAEFILKDSYGKENTFNREKIFVQNTNGELVQFTEGTGESVLEPLEVTENGTYNPSAGVDGFNKVTVAVPTPEIVLQNKEVTENGTYTADDGFDGLNKVTVAVPIPEITLQDKTITENGTYSADDGFYGFGSVTVDVTATSADVRYVTFMSYDGTIEYGKKAVAVGDDCADPIARGIFGTPTRESDAQYDYTYSGWATESNGAANSNWNEAITEDKTVYASFTGTLRYYTITYYDSDGTTILNTESLAYGATPNYIPSKSGYSFAGWEQKLETVTCEASYIATWTETVSFSSASWARIAEIAEAGKASEYFKVGDTKTIAFNFSGTTENVKARIIGFNHDNLADGSGKAGISIALSQGIANSVCAVKENTTYGTGYIWKTSASRALLNSGAVYNALPSDLRSVLKSVIKISNSGYSENYGGLAQNILYETTDKVWLLSATEFGVDNTYSSSYVAIGQGEPYNYYANGNATRRKMKTTDSKNFWIPTRSMMTQYANSSVVVMGVDGTVNYATIDGSTTCPRMFGFCI